MTSRYTLAAAVLFIGLVAAIGCRSMYGKSNTGSGTGTGGPLTDGASTASFFNAVQVDPRSEDSAGPQFAKAGDLDGDGMLDLASAWNESQPIQIHLQRQDANGNTGFATLPLGGTTPIARTAGLEVADIDDDGNLDVVVLIKDTGLVALCDLSRDDCDVTDDNGGVVDDAIQGGVVIFFNPGDADGLPWIPTILTTSLLAGRDDGSTIEEGGYTDLAVGDIDGVGGPDIVVAFNSGEGEPQLNSIDLWPNPGAGLARNGDSWTRGVLFADLPPVGACRILDVERDGDNDVVVTYPNGASSNVRWLVNPLDLGDINAVFVDWSYAPIGQVSRGANRIELGDIDGDGLTDVLVRSTEGKVVQWFKAPNFPNFNFIRNPWQVYTIAEFTDRAPRAMAVGDLTGDEQVEVAISAEGAVAWFDSAGALSVFDQWEENLVVDDQAGESNATANDNADTSDVTSISDLLDQLATDPQQQTTAQETTTNVNTLLIVDLDGDGANDMIGTLDRVDGSGLTSDALFWFRSRNR